MKEKTSDLILEVLARHEPLAVWEIRKSLPRKQRRLTPQAVHKLVTQMVQRKQLKKTKDGYVINKDHAKKMLVFWEKIYRQISKNKA